MNNSWAKPNQYFISFSFYGYAISTLDEIYRQRNSFTNFTFRESNINKLKTTYERTRSSLILLKWNKLKRNLFELISLGM